MKKRPIALTALGLAPLLLAACAPSDSASDEESITLTIWSWRTEDQERYDEIFDVYEEANPGVTIVFETFTNTDYTQILTTGLTGENAEGPDVVQVQGYSTIQPYIQGGNLVPIEELVDGLDNIDPAALLASTGVEDGLVYGVPFATQQLVMWYNVGIFDELGLQPPTTWDEYLALNEALAGADYVPIAVGGADAWTLTIVHSVLGTATFGGDALGESILAGDTDFADPAFVDSLQVVSDLQQYMPGSVTGVAYTEAQSLFLSGQAATFPSGSFEQSFFESSNPDLELGVFVVPGRNDEPGAVTAYQDGSFAINANSDRRDAAVDLLEWMTTTEFGQLFSDSVLQPSPVNGVTYGDPIMSEISALYEANPQKYLVYTDFRWGTPTGTEILQPGLQSLLLEATDAETLATDLATGVSEWLQIDD